MVFTLKWNSPSYQTTFKIDHSTIAYSMAPLRLHAMFNSPNCGKFGENV